MLVMMLRDMASWVLALAVLSCCFSGCASSMHSGTSPCAAGFAFRRAQRDAGGAGVPGLAFMGLNAPVPSLTRAPEAVTRAGPFVATVPLLGRNPMHRNTRGAQVFRTPRP